jgi:hypothetical protein
VESVITVIYKAVIYSIVTKLCCVVFVLDKRNSRKIYNLRTIFWCNPEQIVISFDSWLWFGQNYTLHWCKFPEVMSFQNCRHTKCLNHISGPSVFSFLSFCAFGIPLAKFSLPCPLHSGGMAWHHLSAGGSQLLPEPSISLAVSGALCNGYLSICHFSNDPVVSTLASLI